MKQSVMNLIGVLAGLAVGSVLVPPAIFAGLTPLHVTWDGSQCPSGQFIVTTSARNAASGQVFQISSSIRLPAATVGQDFSDLPDGTYLLVASVEGPDEPTLYSRSQTLTVGVPASQDAVDTGGRRRPPAATVLGTAQPRSTVDLNHGGGNARGASESVGVGLPDPSRGNTATLTRTEIGTEVSLAWALETVSRITGSGHGGGRTPINVSVVDEDGDGAIDYVTIAVGRVVRTWRVSDR
jgi:hypothetical protein